MFLQLPYPLTRLTNFGWHGVQLFFLVSCVTLLLSWRSDEAKGQAGVAAFWTRRLFRIAPMYYMAGLLYFVIETPPTGFDPGQLLTTLLFVNAWHPPPIPTVADRWMVVPGGWSIGVEFTFYLAFPLMPIVLLCPAAGVAAANLPFANRPPFAPPLLVPTLLVASLIFLVVAVLGNDPRSPFINRPICLLGQVSFSAYLLHFAVLHKLPVLLPSVFNVDATGWRAIGMWFALWRVAVPTTYGLSMLTFRAVENPMIGVGRRLLEARRRTWQLAVAGRQ